LSYVASLLQKIETNKAVKNLEKQVTRNHCIRKHRMLMDVSMYIMDSKKAVSVQTHGGIK
jgi:hypothetical protein